MNASKNLVVKILQKHGIPYKELDHKPEINFNCPFCNDSRTRFFYNYKKNLSFCWNEAKAYSTKEIYKHFGFSPTSLVSVSVLQQQLSRIDHKEQGPESADQPSVVLPLTVPIVGDAIGYLKRRGFTRAMVERYRLSLCLDGKFAERIIFPIYGRNGALHSFAGRDITGYRKPKYLFAKGTFVGRVVYPKIHLEERSLKNERTVWLFEGQVPALLYDGVCTFGKKISQSQIAMLLDFNIERVVLCWDADAGTEALKAHRRLAEHFEVIRIDLPTGQPDDYGKIQLHELYTAEVRKHSLHGRLNAIRFSAHRIRQLPVVS